MPNGTPEERLRTFFARLTAQPKPWDPHEFATVELDRTDGGLRSFLITLKEESSENSLTVSANLADNSLEIAVMAGDQVIRRHEGEIDFSEGVVYNGKSYDSADDLAESVGGRVAGEFIRLKNNP